MGQRGGPEADRTGQTTSRNAGAQSDLKEALNAWRVSDPASSSCLWDMFPGTAGLVMMTFVSQPTSDPTSGWSTVGGLNFYCCCL